MALIIAQALKNNEGKSANQDSTGVSPGERELKSTTSRQDNPDSDTNTGRPSSGSEMPNNGIHNMKYLLSILNHSLLHFTLQSNII